MSIFGEPERVSHQDIYNRITVLETSLLSIADVVKNDSKVIQGLSSYKFMMSTLGTIAMMLMVPTVAGTFWLYGRIVELQGLIEWCLIEQEVAPRRTSLTAIGFCPRPRNVREFSQF